MITESFPVSFNCFSERSYLTPKWTKDDEELSPTENINFEELPNGEYKLSILKTKLSDKGKYKIVLNGIASEAELKVKGIILM